MPEDRSDEELKNAKRSKGSSHQRPFEVTILQRGPTGEPVGSSHSFAEDDRSVTAFPSADNQMDVEFKGRPSKGEAPVPSVYKELFDYLKAKDGGWERLVNVSDQGSRDEQGIDCYLEHSSGRKLAIQVTRAVSKQKYWKSISRAVEQNDSFKEKVTLRALVDDLRCSIEEKAKKTSETIRRELTLVLDATETAHAAVHIAEAFRSQYANWTMNLGFRAVWLIGRSVDFVFRLDNTEEFRLDNTGDHVDET